MPSNKIKRFFKWTGLGLISLFVVLVVYMLLVSVDHPPEVKDQSALNLNARWIGGDSADLGKNWIRRHPTGLWEMYLEGKPFDRGVYHGKLAEKLMHEQETAFAEQIYKMVPSAFYRGFLKYFIAWFNRNLDESVNEENKLEIYGVSRSASIEFDEIGTAYQRMLNYHAAHDIGHALQNLALVGCTSFARWDTSRLLVGRNFDFYVGDRFAENKIIMFIRPEEGYPFMMITWAGFTGVVSGMNMQGLTVTLNAAKSDIPTSSATPVSLLAREILQYASNIEEAVEIARNKRTFVAESFLIASAKDGRAVSIEKTPDVTDVYESKKNEIICTNHFESQKLKNTETNRKHMEESASLYRMERVRELMNRDTSISETLFAEILRDRKGKNGTDIGMGNEKSINQLICHHSVIMDPVKRIVWISTPPWQLGEYIVYRLDSVFNSPVQKNYSDHTLTIPADSFLYTPAFTQFNAFREMKQKVADGKNINVDSLIQSNPLYYHTYVLAGDYSCRKKLPGEALQYYEKALTLEIANDHEKQHILEQINKIKISRK